MGQAVFLLYPYRYNVANRRSCTEQLSNGEKQVNPDCDAHDDSFRDAIANRIHAAGYDPYRYFGQGEFTKKNAVDEKGAGITWKTACRYVLRT